MEAVAFGERKHVVDLREGDVLLIGSSS